MTYFRRNTPNCWGFYYDQRFTHPVIVAIIFDLRNENKQAFKWISINIHIHLSSTFTNRLILGLFDFLLTAGEKRVLAKFGSVIAVFKKKVSFISKFYLERPCG